MEEERMNRGSIEQKASDSLIIKGFDKTVGCELELMAPNHDPELAEITLIEGPVGEYGPHSINFFLTKEQALAMVAVLFSWASDNEPTADFLDFLRDNDPDMYAILTAPLS